MTHNISNTRFDNNSRNLGTLLPIALIPAVVSVVVNYMIIGPTSLNTALAFTDPAATMAAQAHVSMLMQLGLALLGIVLWGFTMTSITKATYDIKSNGSVSVGASISIGVRYMLPVLPIVVVSGIAIYASLILILPGLYLMGMWFVIVPVFIVEGTGFGSLGRSARLTDGYRWPLAGLAALFVLTFILVFAVMIGSQFVFSTLGDVGLILSGAATAVISAIIYCLGSSMAALAYLRLRELKEGAGISEIAEVFE